MKNSHTLSSLSSEQLSSAVGGQQAVQDMTLGEVVDVARGAGCLDATFQRGMAWGQQGWTADQRPFQMHELPGQMTAAKRLTEAGTACKQGGGF